MKTVFFTLTGILLPYFCIAQTTQFQRIYGTPAEETGGIVQQTSDGGYLLSGTIDHSQAGQGMDFLLVKTDVNGDTLWTRYYGTQTDNLLTCVEQTSDGGYILSGSTRTPAYYIDSVLVIKTDGAGSVQWSKSYAFSGGINGGVHETTGGYYIAGTCDSIPGGSPSYPLLAKLDATGTISWMKKYRIPAYRFYSDVSFRELSTGDCLLASTATYGGGLYDIVLIKTDTSGNPLWVEQYDKGQYDICGNICEAANGDIVVCGTSHNNISQYGMLLMRVGAPSGNLLWSFSYSSGYEPVGIAEMANGDFVVPGGLNWQAGCARVSSSGTIAWARTYSSSNFLLSFDQTVDGGFALGGYVYLGIDSGSLYLIKTDSLGNSGCNDGMFNITGTAETMTTFSASPVVFSGGSQQITPVAISSGLFVTDPCPVGVEETSVAAFTAFPNPFTDHVTLDFGSFPLNHAQLILTDLSGREVYRQPVTSSQVLIVRNGLASGVYFYRFSDENGLVTGGKLVAE
jgi:hypothetical protein